MVMFKVSLMFPGRLSFRKRMESRIFGPTWLKGTLLPRTPAREMAISDTRDANSSAYLEWGIVPFDVISVYMPLPAANVQADYPHGLAFLSYIIASSGACLAILDAKRHSRKSR